MHARPALIVTTAGVADWAAESNHRTGWLAHCSPAMLPAAGATSTPSTVDRRANDHAARTRNGRLLSCYDLPAWL